MGNLFRTSQRRNPARKYSTNSFSIKQHFISSTRLIKLLEERHSIAFERRVCVWEGGGAERRNQLNKVTVYSIGRGQSTLSCFQAAKQKRRKTKQFFTHSPYTISTESHGALLAFMLFPSIAQFSYFIPHSLHLSIQSNLHSKRCFIDFFSNCFELQFAFGSRLLLSRLINAHISNALHQEGEGKLLETNINK